MTFSKKRTAVRFRKIKRKLEKAFKVNREIELNEVQKLTFLTIRKLINQSESTLLIAPLSNSCYVEVDNFFVKFDFTKATITNSKYSYYVDYDYENGKKLVDFFNKKVEVRRQALEQKYHIKTVENLNSIIESIQL
jgi:hypothetical protein